MRPTHIFAWRNNPRRAELFGRRCRVLARSRDSRAKRWGSVLVEWEDGARDIVSRRALRRIG